MFLLLLSVFKNAQDFTSSSRHGEWQSRTATDLSIPSFAAMQDANMQYMNNHSNTSAIFDITQLRKSFMIISLTKHSNF